ncbi:MAG: metal-sensitive transcriptional regulator [Candidatus Ancillula sp.]|jgi:DNA-binding FrmR family transcriptional regulator|nr:metal-sensitive transcriptional regulator [Candidatus Ancillula sp.]
MLNDIKERLIHRTAIISGQVSGLRKMIEEERYCPNIVAQSIAVQKSLASMNKLLLENHLRTHLRHQLASEDVHVVERAVDEMLQLYELGTVRGGVHGGKGGEA